MMKGYNRYLFFLSGSRDNERLAQAYLENRYPGRDTVSLKLPYDPPFREFRGIRLFQKGAAYHPFRDQPVRKKLCILDLSEWVEHPRDEYLETFFAFLHDYRGFFQFTYVFTAGEATADQIRPLRELAARYLVGGRLHEDHTLTDPQELRNLLLRQYDVDRPLAAAVAGILVRGGVEGLAQVQTVLDDLCLRFHRYSDGNTLSAQLLAEHAGDILQQSALYMMYGREVDAWLRTAGHTGNGKENVHVQ